MHTPTEQPGGRDGHAGDRRSGPVSMPFGGPPRVAPPSREIYAAMGEANITRMLEDFYGRLVTSPIAGMFPADPAQQQEAAHKSAAFFVGLLGGPPLYQQRYGSPALRARHMPFPIDANATRVWLDTFKETLQNASEAYGFPAEYLPGFVAFLEGFAPWMENTAPQQDAGAPRPGGGQGDGGQGDGGLPLAE